MDREVGVRGGWVPADAVRGVGQVHVQGSQQQVDVVDPQVHAERDGLEALHTHLQPHTHQMNTELTPRIEVELLPF